MADNVKQTGKPDDERINVEQDHAVRYWSAKFGVSRDELRRAIQQVGPMAKDVQQHLNISTKPSERSTADSPTKPSERSR
jgi:hypothetical protein